MSGLVPSKAPLHIPMAHHPVAELTAEKAMLAAQVETLMKRAMLVEEALRVALKQNCELKHELDLKNEYYERSITDTQTRAVTALKGLSHRITTLETQNRELSRVLNERNRVLADLQQQGVVRVVLQ